MNLINKHEKIGYYITCLPETIGWYYKAVYMGHTLTRKNDGWLLIVRIKRTSGRFVTFYQSPAIWGCFLAFGSDVSRNQVKWRPDLYQSTGS